MSLKPDRPNSEPFQLAPEGTHVALCTHVIDMGMQTTPWGIKRQVYIAFELSEPLMADGRPFIVSRVFTNSLHEKSALRQIIEPWIGRKEIEDEDFELSTLAGRPALVIVSHREGIKGVFADILFVAPLPKGTLPPKPMNKIVVFDIDESDSSVIDGVPIWLRNRVFRIEEDTKKDLDIEDTSYFW